MSARKRQTAAGTTSDSEPVQKDAASTPKRPVSGRQAKTLQRKTRYGSIKSKRPFWRSPAILVVIGFTTALLMYLGFRTTSGSSEGVSAPKAPFRKEPVVMKMREELQKDPSKMYVVVDLPPKGKGMVATRNIMKGERILTDRPVLRIPATTEKPAGEYIQEQMEVLNDTDRKKVLSLSYPDSITAADGSKKKFKFPKEDIPLAIVQTNAFGVEGGMMGVFPEAARMNHGCSAAFNAVYSWREAEGQLYVHALRDIKQGEEILTSYTNTKRPRSERQEFLSTHYIFDCKCSVCSLPKTASAASDARLNKMRNLHSQLASWSDNKIDGKEAIEIINLIWKTGGEEGYLSERGMLASDAALVAMSHADDEAAKAWNLLAAQNFIYELGTDHPKVMESLKMAGSSIEDLVSHPTWGTKTRQKVGGPTSGDQHAKIYAGEDKNVLMPEGSEKAPTPRGTENVAAGKVQA